jgi:hypothetical protein
VDKTGYEGRRDVTELPGKQEIREKWDSPDPWVCKAYLVLLECL